MSHLRIIWNADWPKQIEAMPAPHLDPSTLIGCVYQNALYAAAGLIPEGPLPEEALNLFKEQVRNLG